MENKKLREIKRSLEALPVLERRREKLQYTINEAQKEVNSLLKKYESESLDVERLEKDSLSTTLLKFIGKYEDKLDKESKEMIAAKMEYDKACHRLEELQAQQNELISRISSLKKDKEIYEAEVKRREEIILYKFDDKVSKIYRQLEEERKELTRQLVEMDEAISAAKKVIYTARSVLSHLESAEGWATYDVWVKGGIFTHMAKYDHIDQAEADFNRLRYQINDLRKDLSDINIIDVPQISEIDGTTRVFDFWFDNIFTDLNVMNRIKSNIEEIRALERKIEHIIYNIENNKSQINNKIEEIEEKKKELIISL
ncbi:hypothetical protein [Defluviitalea phaphyphila]|uniref:hypothetical protein n=1 Tax=Defluviitalea phaphyphila TaxID=1473580 RepID=UPI0007316718|nr:hypothetical protein [Defluviitalea phaphyphila]